MIQRIPPSPVRLSDPILGYADTTRNPFRVIHRLAHSVRNVNAPLASHPYLWLSKLARSRPPSLLRQTHAPVTRAIWAAPRPPQAAATNCCPSPVARLKQTLPTRMTTATPPLPSHTSPHRQGREQCRERRCSCGRLQRWAQVSYLENRLAPTTHHAPRTTHSPVHAFPTHKSHPSACTSSLTYNIASAWPHTNSLRQDHMAACQSSP